MVQMLQAHVDGWQTSKPLNLLKSGVEIVLPPSIGQTLCATPTTARQAANEPRLEFSVGHDRFDVVVHQGRHQPGKVDETSTSATSALTPGLGSRPVQLRQIERFCFPQP